MPDLPEGLTAARDLVAQSGGWTQGWFARTAGGRRVDEHGADAACFCPMGALFRVRGAVGLGYLRRAIGMASVAAWNDAPGRTQDEVVAAFDAAIAFAEAA